jgi:hypothetical protein
MQDSIMVERLSARGADQVRRWLSKQVPSLLPR